MRDDRAKPHRDDGDREVDWFGHAIGADGRPPRPPVACPYCEATFTDAATLRSHAADAHDVVVTRTPTGPEAPSTGPARLQGWWRGLRFLPLWFVLPLNILLVWLVWLSVSDPLWNPAASLLVRMALLPSILLLAARVAGKGP